MSAPPPPPGWSSHRAPDGRWYYAHAQTGTTQWHHPNSAPSTPPPPLPGLNIPSPTTPPLGGASSPVSPPIGGGAMGPVPVSPSSMPAGYPVAAYPSTMGPGGQGHQPLMQHAITHQPNFHYQQQYAQVPSPALQHHASLPTHHPHAHPQLTAVPLGLPPLSSAAARFILQQPTEFKLQERAFSLSGDAFDIKRADTGEPYFKVKGNALSMKDSKTLFDMNGTPIYKMSEAIISLRNRMNIIDAGNKQPVMTLRKKGFIPGFGTSVIQAWAGATDEGSPYLEIKGDFLKKNFSITEKGSGRTLASVRRKSLTLSNIFLEKDSYVIRVEPGVDTALLVFFVVAADEQYRDDGNRKGFGQFF